MSRFIGGLVAAAMCISCGFAAAGDAPAVQPAIASASAPHSLLLDVAWAGRRLVAVGERGHIVLSDDQGHRWRQAPSPVRSLLAAVTFATPKEGWAVGHEGVILHTADGGDSWVIQRRQPFDADAAAAAEEQALAEAGARGIDVNSDAGVAIGMAASSRIGAALLDVWFADARHGYVVGANGTLLETVDGGATWRDASSRIENPDGWHLNAIAALPGAPGVMLIGGEKGLAFRSGDGGKNFARVQVPGEGSWFGAIGVGKDFYLFGLQGRLLRSTDGGRNWRTLASGVTSGLNDGVAHPDGAVTIAGNAGVVVTVSPGGVRVGTVHRTDRHTIASAALVGEGLLLVGEGGVRLAKADGQP